ncbi:TrbI/VirB10 family protein [Caulobacter soli]|uniref:TrbI/VirB10 family protein n=1 Tax=Caulobacter soli TaxID=2708539 RepID=UPI0013EA2946|nr:TrbI/VirB10 family protein [Caulobacter soli]
MSAGPESDPGPPPQVSAAAKASPRSVLQAPRRPIARYRPAIIVGAGFVVLLLVGLGFMIAFGEGRPTPKTPAEAVASADPPPTAPIDDRLPATYGDLGPPTGAKPGGSRPPASPAPAAAGTASPLDPAQQRGLEDRNAARRAGPFFGGAPGSPPVAAPSPPPMMWQVTPPDVSPVAPPAGGAAKEAFVARASAAGPSYAAGLPQPPLSPYEVKAGTVIPAALITGLNSDLPGMAVAQVTEPVFDHRTGRRVLIPQGARLIGKYDSQVGYGQDRLLLVWTRLIYPSGRSVELGGMIGADATGVAGLSDRVDAHLTVLARAIGLSTLISIGAAAAQNSQARGGDSLVLQDAAGGVAAQASQTGQRLVDRDLQRAPTLRIRPGFPVRVMVDKDLILPPEVEAGR